MTKKKSGLDPASGGKARAQRLSSDERKRIAIAAAEKRWGNQTPEAHYDGTLAIGNLEFPCAVLSDGTRVLTEMNFMKGMEMYRSGALSIRREKRDDASAKVPLYLAFKNLAPYVEEHLGEEKVQPLKYRTTGGNVAHGIRADLIPKICNVWLDARRDGVLGPRQLLVAERAEMLMRGLAQVGIIALVDEATGFQDVRARDALAKILEEFVSKELRKWVKTFPPEFYRELCRLRDLPYPAYKFKKPAYFGHLTNNIVYDRLAPGVRHELKRVTPRDEKGRHAYQLHRHLTEDSGHPKLREHLASVVTLMKISDNWDEFMKHLDRAHPKYGDTMELQL